MSSKDPVIGSSRPRSPGSPSSARPAKVQKTSGLRWSDKLPSEDEQVTTAPIPRDPVVIREFDASSPNKGTATTFTCTTGELLWGHLNTVIQGSEAEDLDTIRGPRETSHGGTIIQENFRYRAKARKGVWKVEPAFIGDWHIGYVCYHEDVSGLDILRHAATVGISNGNVHRHREIVYVNRYDWGHWHEPGLSLVLETLGLGKTEEDVRNLGHDNPESMYFWRLVSTRFMLMDPEGLPCLIQALKDGEKLDRKNYLLSHPPLAAATANGSGEDTGKETAMETNGSGEGEIETPEGITPTPAATAANVPGEVATNGTEAASRSAFGVNLVTKGTEYELGWMAFEKGELVGFVYDGEYSALEIVPEGSEMKLGGKVVMCSDHESEEEDPPYSPSAGSESTDSEASTRYYVGSEDESEAASQSASGQTAASKEEIAGDEEQVEESVSKDTSTSILETIAEEDLLVQSGQGTDDIRFVGDLVTDPGALAGPSPPPLL